MISFFLVALAAIGNAMMDILDERFELSIFKNKDAKFWSKAVSWKYAKRVFGYKIDAWHLTKSVVIILLCLAVVVYRPTDNFYSGILNRVFDFCIMGAIWNIWFNLFYHKVFSRK